MIIRTTSHRSRSGVESVLKKRPPYYYNFYEEGSFIKLEDPVEIEAVLRIKGVSKCRNQDDGHYSRCHG